MRFKKAKGYLKAGFSFCDSMLTSRNGLGVQDTTVELQLVSHYMISKALNRGFLKILERVRKVRVEKITLQKL